MSEKSPPEEVYSKPPPDGPGQSDSDKRCFFFGKYKLQTVLALTFVSVVMLAVSLTWFVTIQTNQYAVSDLAGQIQDKVTDRIDDQISGYLKTPHLVNKFCSDSINLGHIDIHDSSGILFHFRELSLQFDSIEAICFGSQENGNYTIISRVGAPGLANGTERFYGVSNSLTNHSFIEYRLLPDGEVGEETLMIPEYDPRTRSWYQAAVEAEGPAWTPVYMWLEGVVSIDAVNPVYSDQGTLIGVVDTSLTLGGIGDFLHALNISENGEAFIIDRSGMLIAASSVSTPYKQVDDKLQRISAFECDEPVIQNITQFIYSGLGKDLNVSGRERFTIDINGGSQLVQVSPFKDSYGLDWLVVVVIPESDFTAKIQAHNKNTFFILLLSVIATIILCIILARHITRPVLAMNESAKALARGDFESWTKLDREDELGELSHSLKSMADHLRTMFTSLKSSEERYMSLFQASVDAVILCKHEYVVEINRAAEEMFSLSGKTATGKKISGLLDDIGPIISQMIEPLENAGQVQYDSRIITRVKNGYEQYLDIRVSGVTSDGENLSLVHIRDITMERRAIFSLAEKEALHEAYSRIEMILELLPDPVFVIDNNGMILFWNRAMEKITGHDSKEMIHNDYYTKIFSHYSMNRPLLIHLALNPELINDDLDPPVERSGEVLSSSYWVDTDGKMRYYSMIAAPLHDHDGRIFGAIESLRDITIRKQTEDALLVANKKLNLLSGITRHDIRNKILVSKSFLLILEEDESNPEKLSLINRIRRSMTDIEQLVEFSKTYQEIGQKAPEWQDVGTIFSRAANQVDIGNIKVQVSLSGVSVLCDPLFEKVCYNLVENAVRHGENLTKIEVHGTRTGAGYQIIVEDDGVGIPDDDKPYIFDKGFGKNTGFGLFLIREILSLSDITITENGRYGTGSRFEMDVPAGKFRVSTEEAENH